MVRLPTTAMAVSSRLTALRPGLLREIAGAVPTPHGLIEVRITGAEAEIDSPVPAVVIPENGSEIELDAGTNKVTVR